jgi:uncharacterized protein
MTTPADERTTTDSPSSRSHLELRHDLHARFGPAQVAVSADGATVHVMGPVDSGLVTGGFAVIEGERGDPWTALVVHVQSVSLVDRQGPALQISVEPADPDISVSAATVTPLLRSIMGTGTVLGAIGSGTFTRHHHVAPFGERIVRPATPTEVAVVVAGLDSGAASIEIGSLRQAPDVPARLVSKGFARHTFMCGQSGSGKTYTTGVLFERLLSETSLPMVILDPNSDHVHLGTVRDPTDESADAARFRAATRTVRVARARGLDASFVLCADFSDVGLDWQALLLRLDPIRDADEFDMLRRLTGTLDTPFSVHDVVDVATTTDDPLAARLARRIGNLGLADWDVWRRGDETSLATVGLRDERCVVLDLGSLSRPEERTTVALALLGSRWQQRRERRPVLIAIDEAHNVIPAVTEDPLLRATTDLGVLIAGEGRKFGLHLFVATQRPSKVHPNVVSQCDNLIVMRMNGRSDVDDLVTLFSHVPEAMIRSSTGFALGQALVAGPISPVPTVVQVGTRRSPEGGSDVPTDWATPSDAGRTEPRTRAEQHR